MNLKDEDVVEMFFEVMKLNRSYSENRYGNMDVFRGQYSCLFILERTGPISQKELAGILRIRPASAGEILAKLEQKGLVRRTPSRADGGGGAACRAGQERPGHCPQGNAVRADGGGKVFLLPDIKKDSELLLGTGGRSWRQKLG